MLQNVGSVKHATFAEKLWFDEAVTCRSRAEIGIPATPDESFILDDDDTIATVQRAHREACESSRRATSSLGLVFGDPFAFDIGRDPNPHVGFGGGGPHFCLGRHLAALELRVLFETIAERMPCVSLDGEVRRLGPISSTASRTCQCVLTQCRPGAGGQGASSGDIRSE